MADKSLKERVKAALKKSPRPAAATGNGSRPTATAKGKEDGGRPLQRMPKSGTVQTHWDLGSNNYFVLLDNGNYQRLPKEELTKLLRRKGFSDKMRLDDGLSWVESELLDITLNNSVNFAGALGGYFPGLYSIYSSKILVTVGPTPIKPVAGSWPNIKAFLDSLLGDQVKYFAGWVKVSLQSLRQGYPWSPGQMLAIAGPSSAGKSNLQRLLTPLLGNRVSSPYEYMASNTSFNAEIYGAEHGLIGDTNHKTDARARRNFGAAIKKLVAEPLHYIRGLYKAPTSLTPFLRLSMTCNDNDEALKVLPSIDSDVAGKILLLRARPVHYEKLTAKFRNWPEYWAKLEGELPAFVHSLTRWQIPESIADTRYGVVSFKDHELLARLQKLTPEDNLLETLDGYLFADAIRDEWTGTAAELCKKMAELMTSAGESRLYQSVVHCGQLLSLLADKYPDRVSFQDLSGRKRVFTISKGE